MALLSVGGAFYIVQCVSAITKILSKSAHAKVGGGASHTRAGLHLVLNNGEISWIQRYCFVCMWI